MILHFIYFHAASGALLPHKGVLGRLKRQRFDRSYHHIRSFQEPAMGCTCSSLPVHGHCMLVVSCQSQTPCRTRSLPPRISASKMRPDTLIMFSVALSDTSVPVSRYVAPLLGMRDLQVLFGGDDRHAPCRAQVWTFDFNLILLRNSSTSMLFF